MASGVLGDLWLSQLWRFGRARVPDYGEHAGRRLMVGFVALALVALPLLQWALRTHEVAPHAAARLAILGSLLAAALAVPFLAGVRAESVGLRAPAAWHRREWLFLLVVGPAAGCAFVLMFAGDLRGWIVAHGVADLLVRGAMTGLLWGVLQEVLYRGLLQTELVRRFGAPAGIVAANLVFTFGPLHWRALHPGDGSGAAWGLLAATFAIGLVFGGLFQRSGNVWIPGLLHGLWPANYL